MTPTPVDSKKSTQQVMQERIMVLEMAMITLVNGLRMVDTYPKGILDRVEKLVTSR